MTADPKASAGRCATCKHWAQPDDVEAPDPDVWVDDSYLPEGEYPLWGWCALIDQPDYGEVAVVPAFTRDASDYRSGLHCRGDFGCILHEPDPSPLTPPPATESEMP